jgi:predicted ribonuclease YlaK
MSPKKRRNTLFSNYKPVDPLTDGQRDVFEAYQEGFHLLLHGVAGTGKTHVSLGLAIKDLLDNIYKKIIIIRSIVPTRETGFLPGTLEEKSKPYEESYITIVDKILGNGGSYNALVMKKMLEFRLTSHLRSLTFEDSIIIVDEIQNMGFGELDTVITRTGKNCRVILVGDIDQNDLTRSKYDVSGLPIFLDIINNMKSFDSVEFTVDDIVRNGLVKEYIITKNRLGVG